MTRNIGRMGGRAEDRDLHSVVKKSKNETEKDR